MQLPKPHKPQAPVDTTDVVDEPELSPDIEEPSRDQITSMIAEEFAGHDLAAHVTALLQTEACFRKTQPSTRSSGCGIHPAVAAPGARIGCVFETMPTWSRMHQQRRRGRCWDR